MGFEEQRYLIIGGAPKAGTSSLYKWLADHPNVCASSLKETRFFLDANYPLPHTKQFNGTNQDEYPSFFRHHNNDRLLLRVEATPDYLYSKTALCIAELLPYAKIVFILRDPVERMVSWFKYARQRGLIRDDMSFEEYVFKQMDRPVTVETPIHLRALDQCRYEKYLPAFREAFGERCMTVEFDELKNDPLLVMRRISEFSEIEPTFYDSYHFMAKNISRSVRSDWVMWLYNEMRRKLSYSLHDKPMLMNILRTPNRFIKKILSVNIKRSELVKVSTNLEVLIRQEALSDTLAEIEGESACSAPREIM